MDKITLTVDELSNYVNIGKTTIYSLVKSDEIPHVRVGNRILFNKELVKLWTMGEYVHVD